MDELQRSEGETEAQDDPKQAHPKEFAHPRVHKPSVHKHDWQVIQGPCLSPKAARVCAHRPGWVRIVSSREGWRQVLESPAGFQEIALPSYRDREHVPTNYRPTDDSIWVTP